MKKYLKETIILIIQLFFFYIMPLTAGQTDAMGLVVLLIFATFILSIVLGSISNNKIKYCYPLVVSIIFIPSVFIYYNESALIHSLWYLVDSIFGMLIGTIINIIIKKTKSKKED